jgi:glycosyltransferase involved in cell wall biosynthesis
MTYRIVYVDHVARLSGGEIALVRALAALGSDVDAHVILGEHGPLVDSLREVGASVEVLPMPVAAREVRKDSVQPGTLRLKAVAASLQYVRTLRRRLRELQPDVVHTNSLKAALYGGVAGRLSGIPVIWHIRDRIAPDYLPTAAVQMVRLGSRIVPKAVIANSQATLGTLPVPRRGVVVTNTVVYDPIRRAEHTSQTGGGPFRVGIVGRLAPWKGQDVFLESFARAFPDDETEAWVVGAAMFGEDGYADTLHSQARRLGIGDRVVFRGFREDVWAELSQIHLLVHCSLIPEPFGQVVVEGMAAGVPVIAADAGGPAEIITNNVDGILTVPGDVAALAAAMRRVHDDDALRRVLVSGGLARAEHYSPEHTAKALMDVYESVVAGRRR